MRLRRYRERVPFTRRQLTPVWLLLGTVGILLVCGCSGLLLYTVGQGSHDSGAPAGAASAQPSGASSSGQAVVPAAKPPAKGDVAVPKLVGLRLSAAKKWIKAAGLASPKVSDITGKNRVVLVDANWVVGTQEPAAGTRVAASTRITLRVGKPTDLTATGRPIDGVVPNVVCKDLSSAKHSLQAAGFYVLSSVDGTGKGRHQFVDENWVVTKQSSAAGSRPKLSGRITLTVVKSGEPSSCQ
jgi:beta-lactam-binding protein with PASTA domain